MKKRRRKKKIPPWPKKGFSSKEKRQGFWQIVLVLAMATLGASIIFFHS